MTQEPDGPPELSPLRGKDKGLSVLFFPAGSGQSPDYRSQTPRVLAPSDIKAWKVTHHWQAPQQVKRGFDLMVYSPSTLQNTMELLENHEFDL